MRVILGITGGIAAYKSAELTRRLVREGDEVRVIMTRNAAKFISPMTLAVLSQNEVLMEMFPERAPDRVDHIDLTKWADLLLVAPATANILAKFAHGIADDYLSTYYLAHLGAVVVSPAMNSNMWAHPAVQDNIRLLESRGVYSVQPDKGELACGDEGPGRLPELRDIITAARRAANLDRLLEGKNILVTAGPTREYLDPVRFLSNPSTGKMGAALAEEAYRQGAEVTLIHGPCTAELPCGVNLIPVTSAEEMEKEVLKHALVSDALIMTAAVGDFAPPVVEKEKIQRGTEELSLQLHSTPDILKNTRAENRELKIVAFAAEVGVEAGKIKEKMKRKGADMIVANDISDDKIGFASDLNEVTLYFANGSEYKIPRGSKQSIAEQIIRLGKENEVLG